VVDGNAEVTSIACIDDIDDIDDIDELDDHGGKERTVGMHDR